MNRRGDLRWFSFLLSRLCARCPGLICLILVIGQKYYLGVIRRGDSQYPFSYFLDVIAYLINCMNPQVSLDCRLCTRSRLKLLSYVYVCRWIGSLLLPLVQTQHSSRILCRTWHFGTLMTKEKRHCFNYIDQRHWPREPRRPSQLTRTNQALLAILSTSLQDSAPAWLSWGPHLSEKAHGEAARKLEVFFIYKQTVGTYYND